MNFELGIVASWVVQSLHEHIPISNLSKIV